MSDLFIKFFDSSFASRWDGSCTGWTRELASYHILADLLIWLSYTLIPIFLLRIVRNRKDIPFNIFFFLFAAFIISCGLTHLSSVFMSFFPYYYIDFWVKAITAAASLGTAWLLWRSCADIINMPNPFAIMSLLEKKNKDLDDFVLIAAHDLQDPLKQNLVYLNLIKKGRTEFFEESEKNNLRMQSFLKKLLDFARLGSVSMNMTKVNIHNVVTDVIKDLQSLIEESGATIIFNNMPILICDEIQVGRIFQNLLKNSMKNKSDRPLQIEIGAKFKDKWEFSIRDNGIGISEERLPTLFSIYTTKNTSGVGLGLPICKRIVEAHGGDISVESVKGEGTCFKFTL